MMAISGAPFFSVIVPTYRREQVLCDTLAYLLELTYPNYELLVIDQTPSHESETERRLHAYAAAHPDRFRLHRLDQPGLPNARNVGAELAAGEYLLYLDDDIVPPTTLIELHLHNLLEPGVGAVTGGVYVEHKALPPRESPCVILPNGRMYQYWQYVVPRGTTDSMAGGNMSVARRLAIEVGLFDEGYIGRANWEETDFSVRIRKRGYDLLYDPAAAVVHLGHRTGGVRASRDRDEGRYYYESHHNNAYFFAKNIEQRYLPSMLKRELGWILIKQAILQRHPKRTLPSLRGLWDGYRAGRRNR